MADGATAGRRCCQHPGHRAGRPDGQRIGRVSHAGYRRNRGQDWPTDRSRAAGSSHGLRSAETALHIHQLDLSSPSGSLYASGEIALPGADGARRSARRQAASPCAGRMSTWIARWRARATRSLRRLAHARPVARICDCARLIPPRTICLSRLAADASVSLQPIRLETRRRGARLALGGQAQLLLKDGSWSVRHSLTASPSAASLAGTVTGRIHPERNDSTLGGSARLRIDDLGPAVALLADAGVSIPEQYRRDLRGSLDARLEPRGHDHPSDCSRDPLRA